jgi:hypothetical protein
MSADKEIEPKVVLTEQDLKEMKEFLNKTSEEWSRIYKVTVLDPDGWDRKNFQYSWHEEKIPVTEFERRLMLSTVM